MLVSPDLLIDFLSSELSLREAQSQRRHSDSSSSTYASQTLFLTYPDFEKTFILKTDGSDTAVGAVLCQSHDDEERPLACDSCCLSSSESNYSATEKEALAIVWACSTFSSLPVRTAIRRSHRLSTSDIFAFSQGTKRTICMLA